MLLPPGPLHAFFLARAPRTATLRARNGALTLFPPRPLPAHPTQQETTTFPKSSGIFSSKTTIFHLHQFLMDPEQMETKLSKAELAQMGRAAIAAAGAQRAAARAAAHAAAVARRAASPPRMGVELLPWCDVEDTRFDVLSHTPWPTLEVLRCQEKPPRTLRDFLPLDVPEDWLGELLDAKERPEIGRHVRVSAPIVHVDAEVSLCAAPRAIPT